MSRVETPTFSSLQEPIYCEGIRYARAQRADALTFVFGDAHHKGVAVVYGRGVGGDANALGLGPGYQSQGTKA
jgi:hypothetical protein